MEDITRRLRLPSKSKDPNFRERQTAHEIFQAKLREESTNGREITYATLERMARFSIEASCVFWEQWEIASLHYTPGTPAVPTNDDAPTTPAE